MFGGQQKLDEKELIILYGQGLNLSEIAKIKKVSQTAILKAFVRFGIVRDLEREKARYATLRIGKGGAPKGRVPANKGTKRPGVGGRSKGCEGWSRGLRKGLDSRLDKTGKRGNKHWAWKGGVSSLSVRIRQSSEYKEWRKLVFVRDGYKCVECGASRCWLNAHHIKAFAKYPSLRFNVDNGVTLCSPCHKQIHSNKHEE